MTSWTAIVPIKPAEARKTRLFRHFTAEQRFHLTEYMLRHVLGVLQRSEPIDNVIVLSLTRPQGWHGGWIEDRARGLNQELRSAARFVAANLLVLHADLPGLTIADVQALVSAATGGSAIAPDRHLSGTNGLALHGPAQATFCFGPDSFLQHRKRLRDAKIVRCEGLAFDVDEPDDVEEAFRRLYLPASVLDLVMGRTGPRSIVAGVPTDPEDQLNALQRLKARHPLR